MVRRILMWTVMLILLAGLASATIYDEDAVNAWDFDSDYTDDAGGNTLTRNCGSDSFVAGKSGNAVDTQGTFRAAGAHNLSTTDRNFTVSVWVNKQTDAGWQNWFSFGYDVNNRGLWRWQADEAMMVFTSVAGASDHNFNTGSAFGNGHWNHVAWRMRAGVASIWINGTEVANATDTWYRDNDYFDDWTNNVSFGTTNWESCGSEDVDALFDEAVIFNRALTDTEMSDLWNSGTGLFYPFGATPNFTITANNIYGEAILNFTANVSGDVYQSNATGYIVTNLSKVTPSTVNITIDPAESTIVVTTYTDRSTSTDLAAVLNTTYYRLKVNATEINGAAISNFTVNVTDITDGSDNQSLNTTSGSITFNLTQNHNFTVWIDPPGYEIKSDNVTMNTWSVNQTFVLYTTNSISITFKNEETGATINNVSLELISDVFSNNYTTTNGTLYIDLLSPVLYALRYNSVGYTERFYYLNLGNRTHTNLTLYLLANTSATDVTATVYDEGNHVVEDAYIKVLRYDITTNSYIVQEIMKTNFEGEAVLHLVLNDEFYKFIIEYPQGTVKKETSPTYIFATTLTFQILLGEDVAENFYNSEGVSYTLAFNDASNNFRYTFSDSNNIVSQGCLKVYIVNLTTGAQSYNTSCTSSSSATILVGVANTTGTTYEAKAYVYFGSTEYYLTSLTYSFDEASVFGTYGIFLCIILTIVFLFVGIWSKAVALVLLPLPTIFFSAINLIDVSVGIMIAVEIVCVIVAIWLGRRD